MNSTRRIDHAFKRYNAVRLALLALDPDGSWKGTYRVLTQEDNRGPSKEPDEGPLGDGHWTPSWIWTVPPDPEVTSQSRDENSSEEVSREFTDAMRVEWATTVARADRWDEEFQLLLMEMGRSLTFLEWKASQWQDRASQRVEVTKDIFRGLVAYGCKQAAVYRHMGRLFFARWKPLLDSLEEKPDWLEATTARYNQSHLPMYSSAFASGSRIPIDGFRDTVANVIDAAKQDLDDFDGADYEDDEDEDDSSEKEDGYTSDFLDVDCT